MSYILNPGEQLYQNLLRNAEAKYQKLREGCPHVFEEDYEVNTYINCLICFRYFGWYCPDNPNKKMPVCEYTDKIEDYNFAVCIFCGQPDDRDN